MTPKKSTTLNIRLPSDLMDRLRSVTIESPEPMPPSISGVVRRGIELAMAELEANRQTR